MKTEFLRRKGLRNAMQRARARRSFRRAMRKIPWDLLMGRRRRAPCRLRFHRKNVSFSVLFFSLHRLTSCLTRSSLPVAVVDLSSDRDTWTTPLPPFSYPTRSESDPSRSLPSYDSTASTSSSPIDDFSFPLDLPVLSSTSLPLSSEYFPLANDMLFESSSSFYPALSVSPSKLSTTQLLIPRQDFDASYSYAQQDPFLSSPSSISSSTYSSSLSSLDPSDHPFALADELSFYHSDSSVPPSPPFSPSIEPAKENFDFSHCFLSDANGFESLTLPLFQPYPSGPAW